MTRALLGALAVLAVGAAAPAGGMAAVMFARVGTISGLGGQVYGFVRTADGTPHIIQPTSDNGAQGLSAEAISPGGAIRAPISALSTVWSVSVPGLVTLPSGSLEAFFGAIEPNTSDSSVWGITSSDGGAKWSAPVDVRSGPLENLAYASAIAASMNGTTPVLVIPQARNVVVQQGLGQNTPTYNATNSTDGLGSDAHTAVDAGTGQVVARWDSGENGTGGDYIQTVAPSAGIAQKVPGLPRGYEVLADRDKGPGVFGAHTADNTRVRLLRYGGGTVAVGSLSSVTPAALLADQIADTSRCCPMASTTGAARAVGSGERQDDHRHQEQDEGGDGTPADGDAVAVTTRRTGSSRSRAPAPSAMIEAILAASG